jgi:hypothetical protein
MACDILDLRCIFMNELVGSVMLSMLLLLVGYFILASRMKLDFNTTIGLGLPVMLILGATIGGFSALIAFASVIIPMLVAWVFLRAIGGR